MGKKRGGEKWERRGGKVTHGAGHTALGTALANDERAARQMHAALRCMLHLQSLLPNTQRPSKEN